MDYRLDFSAMDALQKQIFEQISSWLSFLQKAEKQVDVLIATQDFTGNTADRFKEYMSTVHKLLQKNMNEFVTDYLRNWRIYTAAVQSMDSNPHAVLDTATMEHVKYGLKVHEYSASVIMKQANQVLSDVSDLLSSCPACHSNELTSGAATCTQELNSFEAQIEGVESEHSSRFSNLEEAIAKCRAAIENAMAQDNVYRQTFTASAYAQSQVFADLYASTLTLQQENNYREAEYQTAMEINAQHEEALKAEMEAEQKSWRQKIAEGAKKFIGKCCDVIDISVDILTLGTGTWVAKMITSGVKNMAESRFDTWAETGDASFHLFELGKAYMVGVYKSAANTGIGKFFGKLGSGASSFGKAAWGSVKSVASGGVNRFISSISEDRNLLKAIETTFDPKEIGKDATTGFMKDGSKDYVSDVVGNVTDVFSSGSDNSAYDVGKIINKGITNTVEGVTKRYTNAAIDYADSGDTSGYKNVFNFEKMGDDFYSGSSGEFGKQGSAKPDATGAGDKKT